MFDSLTSTTIKITRALANVQAQINNKTLKRTNQVEQKIITSLSFLRQATNCKKNKSHNQNVIRNQIPRKKTSVKNSCINMKEKRTNQHSTI
jgi:hypothetical protein